MVDPNPVSPASREELEAQIVALLDKFHDGQRERKAREIMGLIVWPALKASEARERELREELEAFGVFARAAGADLADETVIRLTYDDPEWGETVIGEIFLRPFRRAAALAASLPLDGEGKE